MNQLFLVEDDLSFGAVLKSYLELHDFNVTWVDDGLHAVSRFCDGQYDLCILDVMLPHIDGFTIGREIRAMNRSVPMVYLTAKSLKQDILQGYQIGADDYVTKPFDTEVLLCKIKAILGRNAATRAQPEQFLIGMYQFDVRLRTIRGGSEKYKLSPKEAELLQMLCENQNQLLARGSALLKIWGDDGYFTSRSMDVYVSKLRKYLSSDPSIEIKNIHGSGFMLEVGSKG